LTQYYYLVSSLPMLLFDALPPFTSQKWLEMCHEHVSPDDYQLLSRIGFNNLTIQNNDHPVWQAFASWETALRNELVLQRAQRQNVHPDPFLREAPFYTSVTDTVKDAFAAGSPLAVEVALDRSRWHFIDELENGTQFDLGRLIAYRLKLLLLERKNRFRPEPGLASFNQHYTRILDSAVTWIPLNHRQLDTEKAHD